MVIKVKNVVPVTFNIGTYTQSTTESFSNMLILAEVVEWDDRVRTYSSITAIAEDFVTSSNLYKAANNAFAQTSKLGRKINTLRIGRKKKNQNCIQNITFDDNATAGTFTLSIAGSDSLAINYDDNATAIETAIADIASVTSVSVTFNTGATQAGDQEGFSVEFDGDPNEDFELFTADVSALTSVTTATITKTAFGSAEETWTDAYNAVKSEDNNFSVLCPYTKTKADIEELAPIVEPDRKLVFFLTADSDVLDDTAGNVGETLKDAGYTNSVWIYSSDSNNWANIAWPAVTLPDFLPAINPCYYPITGIDAESSITDTQINNIIANRGNVLQSIGGQTVFPGTAAGKSGNVFGLTTSGDFIDVVYAKYYFETGLSENIYNLLIQETKIPFSPDGGAQIESRIRNWLQTNGVDRGIIQEGSIIVNLPDFSTLDASSRHLTIDDATADLSGAINKITVQFNLTL